MLYPTDRLINPNHKTKIVLVGCGGTGSRTLIELSALSQNLVEMDHLGFEITVFDNDKVEQHNIGRQMFYQPDLGEYKSIVLSNRINRSYGDNIKAYKRLCTQKDILSIHPDVLITCVDNVSFRKKMHVFMSNVTQDFIWIDSGNGKNCGQIIMSLYQERKKVTPTCVDLFPDMEDNEDAPSCSTKQALKKQSFTINKFMANFIIQFLTNIFIDYQIPYTQLYFNSNPFKIKTK
jgi:PRTRC genetic system ThiF family protein